MKIAIIGAGINGLYLAWKLSQKGEQVFVFEKKNKIGKQACSGLFSEKILEFIPQSKELIENKIDYTLIHFPKKTIKVNFSKNFLVISHFELDNLMAYLAERAGAKIFLNKQNIKKEELLSSFDKIIGCDGANSVVRQWFDLWQRNYYLGIQGFINKPDDSNYVETWPIKKLGGFIWKIPRNKETEWGIMSDSLKAKEIFDNFLKKKNIYLENINSALIPQGFSLPENNRITLCGDAAGLVKPWSGGGVVWGLIAAGLLLKNFPDFLIYKKETRRFFSVKIAFSRLAVKTVYFFGFKIPLFLLQNMKIKDDFLL